MYNILINRIMEEKMTYEKPTVQKVEFDFKTRIAASGCTTGSLMSGIKPECLN